MDESTPVGRRIAYWRRKRGITQQALAGLVGRSSSWLVKIESGRRTVEAIKDLLLLARALEVSPGDLIGGFELPPNGGGPLDPPRGMAAVRHAIEGVLPEVAAMPMPRLRAGVKEAKRLDRDGSYQAVAHILPDLLVTGRAAVAADAPGASWCLTVAYQVAASLACVLGEVELGWVAADRAVSQARRCEDPLLAVVSARIFSYTLTRQGWMDDAASVCSDAADAIAPTDDTGPEGWSVWGSLHFGWATVAVGGGDVATAWRLLRDARSAAEHVGEGRNDYWEAFGPASVSANEVTVALETHDAVEALRIADTVEVDDMPTRWRRAQFLIDVAFAHLLRRDDGAAVAVLLEAERHAPEVVRYSVKARELVRVCLGREHRSRTPGLRGLADRLGITDSNLFRYRR
jgi:DNA-binding XRE family transcriptional regulator